MADAPRRSHPPIAVNEFYIKQRFLYRVLYLFDSPPHASSREQLLSRIYFWAIFVIVVIMFDICLTMQFITNISSLNETVRLFFIFATALSVLGKYISVKIKNKSYMKLFRMLNSKDFHPRNPQEEEIFGESLRMNKKLRNGYAYLSWSALSGLILTQYLIDSSELPVPSWNPFNLDSLWRYIPAYVYQCLALTMLCFFNIAFDSLSAGFYLFTESQLKILANRLTNIGANHDESQEYINEQLKDAVKHFMKILKLSDMIENVVSIPCSLQIMCSVLVLIANFYVISLLTEPGDYVTIFKYGVYQFCMLTQIFILCYFANEVTLKSSELSYALYTADWVPWNKVNRKLMLLMMLRFDTPIRIKTINRCYSFNLATFTSIVNSSYSYFALLKKISG